MEYRIVEDQGFIGIEPIGHRADLSHGTFHGKLFVVQMCASFDDSWQFMAAFPTRGVAYDFVDARKALDVARASRQPAAAIPVASSHGKF